MFGRRNQQSVTAGVQEVKATQEGVEDNCGEVTEKVMEPGRYEKEPHGGEGQRRGEDTDEGSGRRSKMSRRSIKTPHEWLLDIGSMRDLC